MTSLYSKRSFLPSRASSSKVSGQAAHSQVTQEEREGWAGKCKCTLGTGHQLPALGCRTHPESGASPGEGLFKPPCSLLSITGLGFHLSQAQRQLCLPKSGHELPVTQLFCLAGHIEKSILWLGGMNIKLPPSSEARMRNPGRRSPTLGPASILHPLKS